MATTKKKTFVLEPADVQAKLTRTSKKKDDPAIEKDVTAASALFRESFMVETNHGGRIEAVPGFNAAKALSQGFKGGRLPLRFRGDRLASASSLEFAFPQYACGSDDRVRLTNTRSIPWRCVAHIVMEGLAGDLTMGTAWFAGPRTLITAGHNLFSYNRRQIASKVYIMPGRDGDDVPFGYVSSTNFQVHPNWENAGNANYDVGVIWLNDDFGKKIGWFGFDAKPDSELIGLLVNNAGYPADQRIGTQWFNAGRIEKVQPQMLLYGLDTEEGQSGSPIFYFDANMRRIVVAIHAYAGCPNNMGIRITPELFQYFSELIR